MSVKKNGVNVARFISDIRHIQQKRIEYGSKEMLKIAYIVERKYLCNPVFFSIAASLKDVTKNIFIETHEEQRMTSIPKEFDFTLEMDKELVDEISACIKSRRIGNIIKLIKATKKLRNDVYLKLNLFKPDALIATSDMGGTVNRLCNDWADKNKRPFFIMQPSFLEVAPSTLKVRMREICTYIIFNTILKIPIGRRTHYANNERKSNFILVWSEYFSNDVVDKSNTFYVGNPAMDNFANNKVKIDVTQPTVLICTQPYEQMVETGLLERRQADKIYEALHDVVMENTDIHFIIKVHPRDNESVYKRSLMDSPSQNFEIIKNGSLYELFKRSDICVSQSSYAAFEAVIYGIPIIELYRNFTPFYDSLSDVSQKANDTESLTNSIKKLLEQSERNQFETSRLKYLNLMLPYFGYSSEITTKTILRIIEWRKPEFK